MSERKPDTHSDATDDVVNYLPGMPKFSREPGRIGRFVQNLLQRRGGLVPVARGQDSN